MLWINAHDSVFQFQQLCTAIEEWDNIPQAIINSLINSAKEMSRCMRHMVTPDTAWFSDPRPYLLRYL